MSQAPRIASLTLLLTASACSEGASTAGAASAPTSAPRPSASGRPPAPSASGAPAAPSSSAAPSASAAAGPLDLSKPITPQQLIDACTKDKASIEDKVVKVRGFNVFGRGGSTVSGKVTTYRVTLAETKADGAPAVSCFTDDAKPPELSGGDEAENEGKVLCASDGPIQKSCTTTKR